MAIRNCEPARTCTFKRGDKVRCKWAKNSDGLLVVGNVYTIQNSTTGPLGGTSVSVEGIEGAFLATRFELVKSSTKPSKIKAGRVSFTVSESIKWIIASHQLPDEGITVLVKTADYVGEAVLDEGEWLWATAMPCPTVQYWAEMPVGPKGGA